MFLLCEVLLMLDYFAAWLGALWACDVTDAVSYAGRT